MKKFIYIFIFSIFLIGCATTNVENKPRIASDNRRLEEAFKKYGGYDILVSRGFDIHSLDYITNQAEFIYALEPYWYDEEGNPLDNHFAYYDEKDRYDTTAGGLQALRKFSNVCFENKYGTKEELLSEGYIENKTMFYYPANGEKDWRVGYWKSGIDDNSNYTDNFKPAYLQLNHGNYGFFEDEDCIIIKFYKHKYEDNFDRFCKEAKKKSVIVVDLTYDFGGNLYSAQNLINSLQSLNKMIYILISQNTYSCGEYTAAGIKSLCQNVKIIGIDTAGMVNYCISSKPYDFPKLGIKNIFIPHSLYDGSCNSNFYEIINCTQSTIKEGIGLLPDYWATDYADMEKSIEFDLGEDYFSWSKGRKLADMAIKCY